MSIYKNKVKYRVCKSGIGQVNLTSLNSGLRVFFLTAVLCFDFLFSSGLRYLKYIGDIEREKKRCI